MLKKDLFVFLLFLLVFYGIFRYSESFNRGYYIIEDWNIIATTQSLDTGSSISTLENLQKINYYGYKRFNPVQPLYFWLTISTFRYDILSINIFLAFLCICTSFLLFKFCLNIGYTYLQSILFALITLIGPATVMYTRPSDAEVIGMLFLSITLFFLSKSIFSQKHQILFKIFFIISLLITSLSKESFLILSPAILFLYLWIYSSKNNVGIIQSLKKNYIVIILPTFILIVFLFLLIKTVKINQGRYSGVDINLLSGNTLKNFIENIFTTNVFLLALFGIFIFFDNALQINRFSSEYIKKNLKNFLMVFILMLLIITPQFILYYKTGFVERYYLPYLMGYSFLLIYLLRIICDSKSISSFIKFLFSLTIITYLIIVIITNTIPAISFFTKNCKETTEVVNLIKKSRGNELLMVFDPAQSGAIVNSLKTYMDHLKINKEYKYDFVKLDRINKFFSDTSFYNKSLNYANTHFGEKLINSGKENADINTILIFFELNKSFIEKNKYWFKENDYKKKKFINYTLYYK